MILFFRLAKAGYGTVCEIEKWEARKVIQALYFENFWSEYEEAYLNLNSEH